MRRDMAWIDRDGPSQEARNFCAERAWEVKRDALREAGAAADPARASKPEDFAGVSDMFIRRELARAQIDDGLNHSPRLRAQFAAYAAMYPPAEKADDVPAPSDALRAKFESYNREREAR